MSANDEDWEVVNYGQKKQQKAQKRKDNKQAVKLREQQEKDEEEARRKAAEEAFYQQYVLSKEKSSSDNDVGSVYSRAFKGIAKRQSQHLNNDMLLPDSDDEDSGLKKKSKAKKSNKPKKPSPKTVAKTIDNQQLKSLLVQYSERFPSNYDVQLKNLAEQFETIFTTADAKKEKKDDKPYVESLDTPMFYLEKDVIETVENWLSKMPEDAVVGYFWFLVTTFISVSIEKSSQIQINGLGIKILIQIIARRFPNAVLRNINPIKQTYTDSNNQKENSVPILKQNVSPIFLWIFGQLLNKTPGAALTVWFQFLLPLLQEQKTASTVKENSIQFVEIAVQNAKNKNGLLDEVNGLVVYERLLSYISSDKGFPARVQSLLPKLLDVNYLFGKGKVPKKLFTLLLSQSASSKQEFRDTVLKSLVSCLSTDSKSFSYWNEIYPNYIAQSNNLLLFITLNWDKEKLSQQFKAKDMIETSKKFTTVNQQLLEGTFVPADKKNKKPKKLNAEEVKEVNMVDATCKALRKKLQSAAKKEEIAESKTGNKEEKSQGTSTLTAILPLSFLVVGVAAYAVLNCCQQEWCSSIGFMNDLMKCP